MNKTTIRDGSVFIGNRNVGWIDNENSILYMFNDDGYSIPVGSYENRIELERMIYNAQRQDTHQS